MTVMDGLPTTVMNNAMREHTEQVAAILEEMKSPPSEDPLGSEEGPKEIVLTTEERLSAENLSLRATVLTMKRQEYINEANAKIADFDREIRNVGQGIHYLQNELTAKYQIDFTKFQIEPNTGRIVPA
jgi:hypothetical protein